MRHILLDFHFSLDWKKDMDMGKVRRTEVTYLAHQVLNCFTNDVFSNVIEFIVYVGAIVLIIYIYAMFNFLNITFALLLSFLMTVCIVSCYIFEAGMRLAVCCYKTSKLCCEQGLNQIPTRKVTKKFWKSRRPTLIHVGSHFVFDTNVFILNFFGKIVLETVINLLLTF